MGKHPANHSQSCLFSFLRSLHVAWRRPDRMKTHHVGAEFIRPVTGRINSAPTWLFPEERKVSEKITLAEDRYFDPDPKQKEIALRLYEQVADKPLVCPHGHVDPRMFADPDYQFGTPADLLLIPDHYIFRMLYSQGIPMESIGVPRID